MLKIQVDLEAVRHNARFIKNLTKCKLCAVVKADAYGHGLIPISTALNGIADYYAVSTNAEAAALRYSGLDAPILRLGEPDESAISQAKRLGYDLSAADKDDLDLLRGSGVRVHIKLDSGMHRLGLTKSELNHTSFEGINVVGVYTHYARNDEYQDLQRQEFVRLIEKLGGKENRIIHAAASGGALSNSEKCFDMIRCGLVLYGLAPEAGLIKAGTLVRALSAKSNIISVKVFRCGDYIGYGTAFRAQKDIKVGVVACGYGDGIRRVLSNKGSCVIGKRRFKIIGNVCMDMFMIDLEDADVKKGDEVEIIGDYYDAIKMASDAQTIPYEIITGFSARATREYIG